MDQRLALAEKSGEEDPRVTPSSSGMYTIPEKVNPGDPSVNAYVDMEIPPWDDPRACRAVRLFALELALAPDVPIIAHRPVNPHRE